MILDVKISLNSAIRRYFFPRFKFGATIANYQEKGLNVLMTRYISYGRFKFQVQGDIVYY